VESGFSARKLIVSGIDRALFQGSFVLRAYATVTGVDGEPQEYYLGHQSVLNRRVAMTV
jgi:tyrosinase